MLLLLKIDEEFLNYENKKVTNCNLRRVDPSYRGTGGAYIRKDASRHRGCIFWQDLGIRHHHLPLEHRIKWTKP